MAVENPMKVLVLPDQISKLIKTFAPAHFSLPHISQNLTGIQNHPHKLAPAYFLQIFLFCSKGKMFLANAV